MIVEPLTCALGVQISDIDLAEAGTNADMAGAISELLLKHKVLFFRDQDMTDAQHAAAARRFGDLEDHPLAASADGEPGIIHIWKSPESPPERYENAWHTDATWRECPPLGAVLRCVECPAVGGDTMWANMELAYERLPDRVKEDIADLRARHSMEASFMAAKPIEQRLAMKERFPIPNIRWCARIRLLVVSRCSSTASRRTLPIITPPAACATGRIAPTARVSCCDI